MSKLFGTFALALMSVVDVAAQPVPIIFTPTSQDGIQIQASTLEVQDQAGIATFQEAVYSQGDIRFRCRTMIVRYRKDTLNATSGAIEEIACHRDEIGSH